MKPEAGRTSNKSPSLWTSEARRERARLEAGTLCEAVRDDVARGALTPDDAYWWTRIVSSEAEMLLETAR
ncbi:MAG TPA: hypothetical protein VHI99_22960 [Vicinamibacterales bacterium]|jgi:hypothetical protein|nr:hypothetical protein [Vicinamibacterales bacterium]